MLLHYDYSAILINCQHKRMTGWSTCVIRETAVLTPQWRPIDTNHKGFNLVSAASGTFVHLAFVITMIGQMFSYPHFFFLLAFNPLAILFVNILTGLFFYILTFCNIVFLKQHCFSIIRNFRLSVRQLR